MAEGAELLREQAGKGTASAKARGQEGALVWGEWQESCARHERGEGGEMKLRLGPGSPSGPMAG
jgi:hypothetical protein